MWRNIGCLTLCTQLLFERGDHLQGECLALLPNIKELSDFFLQDKKTRVSGGLYWKRPCAL